MKMFCYNTRMVKDYAEFRSIRVKERTDKPEEFTAQREKELRKMTAFQRDIAKLGDYQHDYAAYLLYGGVENPEEMRSVLSKGREIR